MLMNNPVKVQGRLSARQPVMYARIVAGPESTLLKQLLIEKTVPLIPNNGATEAISAK